ncbi:hypothetical protein [Aureimonas populi]|uniref:DUF3606 domain-containing protein n=1 Tax=Aureimonas populi TaxID=1701758 RepID=A0ABW5CGH8_9HYPH|nr:hypothetical protein [Aureimonas populi]
MTDTPAPSQQDLDLDAFAAKHDITPEDAKRLIEEVGYDRGALDAAAQRMKLERG